MRVCLLLIALAALSYSAPISNNKHELEAQKLYGSLFSLIKAEKTDEGECDTLCVRVRSSLSLSSRIFALPFDIWWWYR